MREQTNFHLRRGADDFNRFLRIVDARKLNHDAICALLLYRRLGNAQFIDARAHDFNGSIQTFARARIGAEIRSLRARIRIIELSFAGGELNFLNVFQKRGQGGFLRVELVHIGGLRAHFEYSIVARGKVDGGVALIQVEIGWRFGQRCAHLRQKRVALTDIGEISIETKREKRASHLQHEADAAAQIEPEFDRCRVAFVGVLQAIGRNRVLTEFGNRL